MFNFIKNTLTKVYNQFTVQAHALFARKHIDEQTLHELEKLLISADTGVATTQAILASLKKQFAAGQIQEGQDLHKALEIELLSLLSNPSSPAAPLGLRPMSSANPLTHATVYLLVGINGSGKTTFAAKLAHHLQATNQSVLLVAADTFRAAATNQLNEWATRTNSAIVIGKPEQDPASVVFEGCEKFKKENFDAVIIDTAGRLQTKVNLMRELEKIKKIVSRQLPNATTATLLTVDSMLGQNSLEQAKIFHESTQLDGIVLTKMDGTAKGGIVFSIVQQLGVPVAFISFGEQMEQLKVFDANDYVRNLLGNQ